jgi:acetylxylan esterase
VVAVLQMGDPTHLARQAGNKGSSTKDGLFARKNAVACAPYDAITNSWCDTGDQFCDSGLNLFTHLSYFNHQTEIVNFVVSQYNKWK